MIDKKIHTFKRKKKKKFGIKNQKIIKFYYIIALCILYFLFITKLLNILPIKKKKKSLRIIKLILSMEEYFIVLHIIMKQKWHIFLYGDYIIMLINL